jgi:hypothetical protein
MKTDNTSICIKCGKQRIVVATRQEKVGNTFVVYKETICPDPECQMKVEKILAQEKEKRQQSLLNQKQRIADRSSAKKETVRNGLQAV